MSGTFTSWGALVQALQKEVAEATEEVVDDSLDDLYRNVDRFYSSSEGRYHRTGMLRMSPQSYFSGGGSVSTGEISLNTGHGYSPSGRDTRRTVTVSCVQTDLTCRHRTRLQSFWERYKNDLRLC